MHLKTARTQAGLTQAQLAYRAKVDSQTVSRIETGVTTTPDPATVRRICRIVKVQKHLIDEFRGTK